MPRPIYRGFRGPLLRTLRGERGWTQEQLAVRVRSFPSMIGKWERGEVTPGAGSVAKLAAVFGMRAEDFTDADPASMTLVELRVRSGYTRAQAAQTAGISVRRLTQYEHLSCRPGPAEAAQLAQLYNVTAELLLASWDRDRAVAYPGLAPEEAC